MSAPLKLLDQVHTAVSLRHLSDRTEEAYVHWIKRYIFFHKKRHPAEMGELQVSQFLSYLAEHAKVSASTQNQALNSLLFLYRYVLRIDLGNISQFVRARLPKRLPVILTAPEAKAVLAQLKGTELLMASILYGSGLRLCECLQLRVKDVDFGYRQIVVREAKGDKHRATILPSSLIQPLQEHLSDGSDRLVSRRKFEPPNTRLPPAPEGSILSHIPS